MSAIHILAFFLIDFTGGIVYGRKENYKITQTDYGKP